MSTARDRRNRQSALTLVGALVASLALVLAIVVLAVRPEGEGITRVDWHHVHDDAPNAVSLVDPDFTESDGGWWSNRAEYRGGDNPQWYIGFITPTNDFVSIRQYPNGPSADDAGWFTYGSTSTATVAGLTWTVIDNSTADDAGNDRLVYLVALESGGSLIVSGTADATSIELVAERAIASLKG